MLFRTFIGGSLKTTASRFTSQFFSVTNPHNHEIPPIALAALSTMANEHTKQDSQAANAPVNITSTSSINDDVKRAMLECEEQGPPPLDDPDYPFQTEGKACLHHGHSALANKLSQSSVGCREGVPLLHANSRCP